MSRRAGETDGAIHEAAFDDLDTATLYEILRLRCEVFVVEQHCAYRDLDGRDAEPGARHLWLADTAGGISAYVRVLDEGGGVTRLGRVVTAPQARGFGLADRLVRHAVAGAPGPVVADAQEHLTGWYARRGFVTAGAPFLEDGIGHVPMRHPGSTFGVTP